MARRTQNRRAVVTVEGLEDRCVPALISSQAALTPPVLTAADVETLLDRAAVATVSDDAIIAVVDRGGNILGVLTEARPPKGTGPVLVANSTPNTPPTPPTGTGKPN